MVLALSVLWWVFLVCLAMALGAWALFWLSIRSGQFDDPEAVARQMLELDRVDRAPADGVGGPGQRDAGRGTTRPLGAEQR